MPPRLKSRGLKRHSCFGCKKILQEEFSAQRIANSSNSLVLKKLPHLKRWGFLSSFLTSINTEYQIMNYNTLDINHKLLTFYLGLLQKSMISDSHQEALHLEESQGLFRKSSRCSSSWMLQSSLNFESAQELEILDMLKNQCSWHWETREILCIIKPLPKGRGFHEG